MTRAQAPSLLIAVALPLLGAAAASHASNDPFNIDIVAIDLAGRQTNLTENTAVDLSPAVARDGRIVFVSTREGTPDLYVMAGDGGNVRRLTTSAIDHTGVAWNEALDLSQASWSPSGEHIAFDGLYLAHGPPCPAHCANWRVLVIGSDGAGLDEVALNARAPAWSPDGRDLAYESDLDSYYEPGSVTMTRLDGSAPSVRVKAINPDYDVGPVWSPKGGEVAYQASLTAGARTWVYLARADGRRKRRLARGHHPAWSPDGRRLAFIDDYKLITIDRNGKNRRRLSPKGEFVISAAWSTKGSTLAYIAGTKLAPYGGRPRNLRVETVSADGKRVRVLARVSASSLIWGRPVWTHDGRRILVAVEPH
jgi:Tol biopolymer transport system component